MLGVILQLEGEANVVLRICFPPRGELLFEHGIGLLALLHGEERYRLLSERKRQKFVVYRFCPASYTHQLGRAVQRLLEVADLRLGKPQQFQRVAPLRMMPARWRLCDGPLRKRQRTDRVFFAQAQKTLNLLPVRTKLI